MEFRKLVMHNIASVEDAEIDFASGPLADEPLFLICGETGSGKSTILDAICLALYRRTPRLASNSRKKVADGDGNVMGIFDTAQIMRKNTGNAYVRLDFRGADGNLYTAGWYVRRAYDRPDGKIQEDKWRLENHTTGKVYEKKKDSETDAVMEQAVGLTFEQFCRTVMLAQGEFTRFLKSSDNEKSGILEKLTGTERYSEIGRTIYEMSKAKEEAYKIQKTRCEGIEILSDDEIAGIKAEITGLEGKLAESRREKASAESRIAWLRAEKECRKDVEEKKLSSDNAEAAMHSESYVSARRDMEDWNATARVRAYMKSLREAEQKKAAGGLVLEELKRRAAGLSAWNAALSAAIDGLAGRLEDAGRYFARVAGLVPMLEKGPQLADALATALSERRKADEAEQKATALQSDRKRLEDNLAAREVALSAAESAVRTKREAMASLEKKAASYDRKRLDFVYGQSNSLIADAVALTGKSEEISRMSEELESESRALADMKSLLETTGSRLKVLIGQSAEAEKSLEAERQMYEKQKEAVSDWAREMRSRLSAGDICPVCGQEVREMVSDEKFSSLLEAVRTRFEAAVKNAGDLRADVSKMSAETSVLEKNIRDRTALIDKKRESQTRLIEELSGAFVAKAETWAVFLQSFPESDRHLRDETDAISAGYKDWLSGRCRHDAAGGLLSRMTGLLARLQGVAETMRSESGRDLDMLNSLDAEMKSMQKGLDGLLADKDRAVQDKNAAEKNLSDALKDMDNLKKNASDYRSASDKRLADIAPDILIRGWEQSWLSEPERLIEDIRHESEVYAKSLRKREALENTLNLAGRSYRTVSKIAEEFVAVLEKCSGYDGRQAPAQTAVFDEAMMQPKENEWTDLLREGVAFAERAAAIEESMEAARKEIENFHAGHPEIDAGRLVHLEAEMDDDKAAALAAAVDKAETCRRQAAAEYAAAQKRLSDLEKSRPDFSENETLDFLESRRMEMEALISDLDRSIGAMRRQLEQNEQKTKAKVDELSVLAAMEKEKDEWADFSGIFGDATGVTFRKIAQAFILKQILGGANRYLARFTSRYELDCQPGQLNILIRDLYQGNVLRPFSTLSGGESFIVSLALALGLSSMVKGDAAVDILFIDEGFGTLSEDCLNTVMNALSRLHEAGGRKVGIISHVGLLRERIPAQIRLVRQNNTSSRVEVVNDILLPLHPFCNN